MSLCDWRRCGNTKLNEWDRQADKIKKAHFMSVHKVKGRADKDCQAENHLPRLHLSSTSRNGWPQCQTTRWREGLMKSARQKTWKALVTTAPYCHHPPWMAGHSVTYLILFPLLYLLFEVGLAQVNLRLHVLQQVKQVLPQWEESCGSFGTGDGQRQENEVLHSHKMSERLHNYTQTCIALNTDLFTLKYW